MNTKVKALIAGSAAAISTLGAVSPAMAQDWYGDRDGRYDRGYGYNRGNSQDAVRQCTFAAERSASRWGRADVSRITNVDRTGRGFYVSGRIEIDNYRGDRWGDGYGNRWRRDRNNGHDWFRCRVEYGRIVDLHFDSGRR